MGRRTPPKEKVVRQPPARRRVADTAGPRRRDEPQREPTNDLLRETEQLTRAGGWAYDVSTGRVRWTDGVYRIHEVDPGFDPSDPTRDVSFYAPEARALIEDAFARAIEHGEAYDLELPLIRADGERIRVRTNGRPEVRDGRVVRVVGSIVDITERKRGEESLRRSHEALRRLAARLQAVREEERTALSRELHDNFAQLLTALRLDLAWLERRALQGGYHELLEKLHDMWGITDEAVRSVRRFAAELRPVVLESGAFWTTVEVEAARFTARSGIPCSLGCGDCAACRAADDLSVAASIIRILQEALTNVAQHAGATSVAISCRPAPDCHLFSIVDDGRGMAPDTLADPRSIGLAGMRERALSLGGELIVDSAPGRGTTVTVRIPSPPRSEGP